MVWLESVRTASRSMLSGERLMLYLAYYFESLIAVKVFVVCVYGSEVRTYKKEDRRASCCGCGDKHLQTCFYDTRLQFPLL